MKAFVLAVMALVLGMTGAAVAADGVAGVWTVESGKARVEIGPCAEGAVQMCGAIVWLAEPNRDDGAPKRDINNSDEDLRVRPIIGINMLAGMEPDGAATWTDGEIYNPEDGKTYSSSMQLQDDGTLKVKGCVLFICKTQIWTRYGG